MDSLDDYLATVDDAAAGTLRELDAAVRQAAPELESAIKYRMPTYTLDGRWRHWDGPLQGPAASLRVAGGRGSSYCSTTRSACSVRAPPR